MDYLKEKLEAANKLIFVKRYPKAAAILDDLLANKDGKNYLLAHLRRIELAVRLHEIEKLRDQYAQELTKGLVDPVTGKLCVALAEQHGELISPGEAIQRFEKIMKEHGELSVAYFGIALSLEAQGNNERAIFNYQQSLKQDPNWYPSYFGLSQIYYNLHNPEKGDHYFYLFEQYAPHNLYGNFETHKSLSMEFLKKDQYQEAEAAITALTDWWFENRGGCPKEIQLYESLSLTRINHIKQDASKENLYKKRTKQVVTDLLAEGNLNSDVLYFVAKILEEFSEFEQALQFYRKILSSTQNDPAMVQRIGSQFLSLGEYELAKELFAEAYTQNPNQPELRFCLLVARLKIAKVNVEEYLISKERLKQIIGHSNDNSNKVEALSLLHNLLAKFQEDPEVHRDMGDIYLQLGHTEKATRHYQKMYELDPLSQASSYKYATFIITHGELQEAEEVLNKIKFDTREDHNFFELCWLKSNFFAKKKDYPQALELITKAINYDPWNVSYIVHGIYCKTLTLYGEDTDKIDSVLLDLQSHDKSDGEWEEFDRMSEVINKDHQLDLYYARCKLRFLFAEGDHQHLQHLVDASCKYDATKGSYDFLRLLNTNYDSPSIYFGLGVLYKELWQLEIASMWFEQLLLNNALTASFKAQVYLELADCYTWRNVNMGKAIEYGKLALELDQQTRNQAALILAHGYLKTGKMRDAKMFFEFTDKSTHHFEISYLQGLLDYRNGAQVEAKKIWKPLLIIKSENMRTHQIKQEILKYYFESEDYLKNVS
jgi:tetratricopeptide (TPR) repeat protein